MRKSTNKPPEDPPSDETRETFQKKVSKQAAPRPSSLTTATDWDKAIMNNMDRMSTDEAYRKTVAMQSAPPHLMKTNEWLDKAMENMKRMATDETYRIKITKDLS